MLAIEALTKIPDPAQSDIDTERLLARSELLFAGVLWSDGWDGYNPVSRIGARAQKWMALLNAHFLSLPLSILDHDIVVNDAYRRAVEDFRWFIRSDASDDWLDHGFPDDWWVSGGIDSLRGVTDAMRESDLLDWLQAMEEVRELGQRPWISYLSGRTVDAAYFHAAAHVFAKARNTKALPWQIAAGLWWASDFPYDDAYAGAFARQATREFSYRAQSCALSEGEQYALGPLRFHAVRAEVLAYESGGGSLRWNEPDSAGMDAATQRELARFALVAGDVDAARKREADLPPELKALTAIDLEAFAAAKPAPSAINLLPLRLLAELVEKPALDPGVRATVTRLAWTRAHLLGETAIVKRLTPVLAATNPALKPLVDAYEQAWTDEGRRRAAFLLLLKTPGMQPVLTNGYGWNRGTDALSTMDHWDRNDSNWWCRVDPGHLFEAMQIDFYDRPLGIAMDDRWDGAARWAYSGALRFRLDRYRENALRTHPILSQIDWEELGRLAKIPNAPTWLSREAVDWARSGWWWDRYFSVDEKAAALALSVQATRWGCNRDGPNGNASNRAWRVLHELFPDSEAAKNTPYWYN